MNDSLPPITKGRDEHGRATYHFWADPTWDGFDSLTKYLSKYWSAKTEYSRDDVYSRIRRLDVEGSEIMLKHDSQLGNLFYSEGVDGDNSILDRIYRDILSRFEDAPEE